MTIGQALHWMHYGELFPKLVSLLRPGGGAAVITKRHTVAAAGQHLVACAARSPGEIAG